MPSMKILSKSSGDEKRYTLGVVYEPDTEDTDGDFAKAEDIEEAAWSFLANLHTCAKSAVSLSRFVMSLEKDEEATIDITEMCELVKGQGDGLDDEHLQVPETVGTIVESYIAPSDFTLNDQYIKKGTWLLGVVWTPEIFEKIKSGERTGLSMFGTTSKA